MMHDAHAHTNDAQALDSSAWERVRAHASPVDDVITHDSLIGMSEATIIVKNGEGTSTLTFICEDTAVDLVSAEHGPLWGVPPLMMGVENHQLTMEFKYPQNIVYTRDDHLTGTTTQEGFDS